MKVVANRWRYDYFPFALFAIKALFLLVRTMYCKSTFDLVRRHFKKFTKSRPRDFMLLLPSWQAEISLLYGKSRLFTRSRL